MRTFFIICNRFRFWILPTRLIQRRGVNKRKREEHKVIHNSLKRFAYSVQTLSSVMYGQRMSHK